MSYNSARYSNLDRARCLAVAVLVGTSLVSGCAKGADVRVQKSTSYPIIAKLKVIQDEEEIATSDWQDFKGFTAKPDFKTKNTKIQIRAADGWADLELHWHKDSDQQLVDLYLPHVVQISIDNTSGSECDFLVGEIGVHASAKRPSQFWIPGPMQREVSCKLNGQEIGKLGALTEKFAAPSYLLVDTSGSATYRRRSVEYSNIPRLTGETEEQKKAREKIYQKAFLHVLPGQIDFFLKEAPSSIKEDGQGFQSHSKGELLKID